MSRKTRVTIVAVGVLLSSVACGVDDELPGAEVDIGRDALIGDRFPHLAVRNRLSSSCLRTESPTSSRPTVDTCPAPTPPPPGLGLYRPELRWTFEVVGTAPSFTTIGVRSDVFTIQNDQSGLCLTQSTFAAYGTPFYVYEAPCPTAAAPPEQSFVYNYSLAAFHSLDRRSWLRQVAGEDSLEMGRYTNRWDQAQQWSIYF